MGPDLVGQGVELEASGRAEVSDDGAILDNGVDLSDFEVSDAFSPCREPSAVYFGVVLAPHQDPVSCVVELSVSPAGIGECVVEGIFVEAVPVE